MDFVALSSHSASRGGFCCASRVRANAKSAAPTWGRREPDSGSPSHPGWPRSRPGLRDRRVTRENVPRPASSSPNPRARTSSRRARGLSDVLVDRSVPDAARTRGAARSGLPTGTRPGQDCFDYSFPRSRMRPRPGLNRPVAPRPQD